MRQDIYQEGKHKLSIESTDGKACDLVLLPKMIIEQSSMTAKGFDELFFCFLEPNVSHTAAYEKAENVHQKYFQKRKYSDYESFKCNKSKRLNKK